MAEHEDGGYGRVRLEIRVEWQHGARSPAWDELWRRILADLRAASEDLQHEPGAGDAD